MQPSKNPIAEILAAVIMGIITTTIVLIPVAALMAIVKLIMWLAS